MIRSQLLTKLKGRWSSLPKKRKKKEKKKLDEASEKFQVSSITGSMDDTNSRYVLLQNLTSPVFASKCLIWYLDINCRKYNPPAFLWINLKREINNLKIGLNHKIASNLKPKFVRTLLIHVSLLRTSTQPTTTNTVAGFPANPPRLFPCFLLLFLINYNSIGIFYSYI